MDFFYKLFPYQSLIEVDGNTLTAWWIILIVLLFIIYLAKLLFVTGQLKKRLKVLSKGFSEDLIRNDKFFIGVWKDYQESFIDYNGIRKTDDESYHYFNEKNLLAGNTNLSLINSIPATLVGLGILGTFIGLTYGISNFHTTSTEQIKASIESLLSGMGTAFITSIYGMFLSLVFTFFEKIQVNSLHNYIHSLCYSLDRRFKISKEDERIIEGDRQKNLLNDYFMTSDQDGNQVKPGNIFRDLYKESAKQSMALQSFSTDLANLIEAGFQKILNDPDSGVLHELQNLKTEIINLGSKLQDPASEMTQNVVKELESSMAKMIEEFKISMSGSTKTELENLTELLEKAGGSLMGFPEKVELMNSNLNENFKGLQETVKLISEQTLIQSEQSTTRMKEQVEEMSILLKEKIGDLQNSQEILLNKQTDNLETSDNLIKSFNSSIDKLEKLTSHVEESASNFNNIKSDLNSLSKQLNTLSNNVLESTTNFKEAQDSFTRHADGYIRKNEEIIKEIQLSLSKASEVANEYSTKFDVIEKGLQGVFSEINVGLTDYRNTIGDSLKEYLSKYSEALTNTAKSLADQAAMHEEILEELKEQIIELQKRKT